MQLTINENEAVLELGGGNCPIIKPACCGGPKKHINVDVRIYKDAVGNKTVDFTADFSKLPLPISSDEFGLVLNRFVLEHLSYLQTKPFIGEMFRVTKPGGKVICIIPNTLKQIEWVAQHENGWDGKGLFEAASEKLFGSQDHGSVHGTEENVGYDSHKAFFSPAIGIQLFQEAGFENVAIEGYGERRTDMMVTAFKPNPAQQINVEQPERGLADKVDEAKASTKPEVSFETTEDRAKIFDRLYFDGGKLGGGYAGSGMMDFPAHVLTFNHVMARKPESVLELGAGRGYLVKRLQDAGINACGLDISKHCQLTKVCEDIFEWDACNTPWGPFGGLQDKTYDLAVSISFWEHVPEAFVPLVAAEMGRVCKRGLHGIDFGGNPDRSDKTKVTLRPKEWWQKMLPAGHEVCLKDELENGDFPQEVLVGDGKAKVQLGSCLTMFHCGWLNTDILDQSQFAAAFNYKFKQIDIRQGLPFNTGSVDLFFMSHVLEHVNYAEGQALLMECRRCIKPNGGGMRILVPDAELLTEEYHNLSCGESCLAKYDELNVGCANSPTAAGKLWAMLLEGHHSIYDSETLCRVLEETGWIAQQTEFRKAAFKPSEQILRECIEMSYCGASLIVDAVPRVG